MALALTSLGVVTLGALALPCLHLGVQTMPVTASGSTGHVPILSVSEQHSGPLQRVLLHGTGFGPTTAVEARFGRPAPALPGGTGRAGEQRTVLVNRAGTAKASFTLPEDARPGWYSASMEGATASGEHLDEQAAVHLRPPS